MKPNASPSLWKEMASSFRLAFPMILGLASSMIFYIMDAMMVGRLGVVPLAATAFGGNLFALPLVAGYGLNSAMHVLVAKSYGAARHRESTHILENGMALTLAYSAVVAVLFTIGIDGVHWFGATPEVAELSKGYVIALAWSMLPTLAYHAMRAYCEAQNRPWLAFRILLTGLLFNLFLNWLLIYGNWGMPRLGVTGAGLATLLARLWMLLDLQWSVVNSRFFAIDYSFWRFGAVRWTGLRNYVGIGFPSMLQTAAESGTFAFATVMVGWLGAISLAAHNIAIKCAGLAFMVPLGMSFSTGIRVAQALGKNDLPAARRMGLAGFLFALLFMSTTAAVFALFRNDLPALFLNSDDPDFPAVSALAAQLLIIAALFQLFDGLQVIGVSALRGFSDVKLPTILLLLSYWGVSLPVGWWLAFPCQMAAPGVWYGLLVSLLLAAAILVIRFLLISTPRPGANVDP